MDKKNFIKELKALLRKYDVNIQFVCDPCSDTYGIYDGGIAVCENKTGKTVVRSNNWSLDASDLK